MPPKKSSKASPQTHSSKATSSPPPPPFKTLSPSLTPFTTALSKRHVYLTHIDTKPRNFKLKIFLVPVAMNAAVAALFVWRIWYILPWYGDLLLSTLGYTADAPVQASDGSRSFLAGVVFRRAFTFLLDFLLVVFVWPWPAEFVLGRTHSNPAVWRWRVGFRDREIYVRRSRADWDGGLLDDVLKPDEEGKRKLLLGKVTPATNPLLLSEKTGYLTMNAEWDLDWAAMIHAHELVDSKAVAQEAFQSMVLFYNRTFGWMQVDRGLTGPSAQEEERRRQVFLFRDALAAVDKEDLFFRWIEIVQFESSQPGGFGPEKQVEVARQIRELFAKEGIDFDAFWKDTVGSEGIAGM